MAKLFIEIEEAERELRNQCDSVFKVVNAKVKPEDYFITRNEVYTENLFKCAIEGFIDFLKTKATTDVQEVRHGKWIDCEGEDAGCCSEEVHCSECGEDAPLNSDDYFYRGGKIRYDLTSYCSHCGAIMDEE